MTHKKKATNHQLIFKPLFVKSYSIVLKFGFRKSHRLWRPLIRESNLDLSHEKIDLTFCCEFIFSLNRVSLIWRLLGRTNRRWPTRVTAPAQPKIAGALDICRFLMLKFDRKLQSCSFAVITKLKIELIFILFILIYNLQYYFYGTFSNKRSVAVVRFKKLAKFRH